MKARKNSNASLEGLIDAFVTEHKLQAGLDDVNVREAWKNHMGNSVNSYTAAIELKHRTLYVKLNSSVLREELSFGTKKIISMLNDAIGKELIKKLVLK